MNHLAKGHSYCGDQLPLDNYTCGVVYCATQSTGNNVKHYPHATGSMSKTCQLII